MKKILLVLVSLFTLGVSTGFAAPINELQVTQTAVGLGSDTFYLEHKFTDNFILGFQNDDWGNGNTSDIYGQFKFSSNLRGIVGSRNFDSGSETYLGLAVNGPLAPECQGYASLIGGNGFKELRVGANFSLSSNVDLNLDYHSFMPDVGGNTSDVGIGATYKF
ncbi:MAG: hypothetical protein H6Q74_2214 [Firmicutes bacterium]|nr:hypothetical protein [Bacillota bacterium]